MLMKTRIPINKYILDEETRKTIDHLAGPNGAQGRLLENAHITALEYLKLEKHHEEETKFLIKRIEELEEEIDHLVLTGGDPDPTRL